MRGEGRRAGTPDGRRADPDRTPQRLRTDARPGRRTLRAPHRIELATAQRIDGQPSQPDLGDDRQPRLGSEEHTSELQSLMRNSYAVFCLKKKKQYQTK